MFTAFRGSMRGAGSLRGAVTQSGVAVPDVHRDAHALADEKDADWVNADVTTSSDGVTLEARFSEPMTPEELEAARAAMMASYESAASTESSSADSEGSVESVIDVSGDAQMRVAESRRSEGAAVASVMDFALSLARSKRVQESVFAEIMANPDMNRELRVMFAQHGLRVSLDDSYLLSGGGSIGSGQRGALEAAADALPALEGSGSRVPGGNGGGEFAAGRSNPLEHLVDAVLHAVQGVGGAVGAYVNRVKGHIAWLVARLQGAGAGAGAGVPGGRTVGKDVGAVIDDEDAPNAGMVLLELASAVAAVLVVAVFLRRLPMRAM